MATTVNLRKLLHRKSWEYTCPVPTINSTGHFIVSDKFNLISNSLIFLCAGYSAIWRYDGDEDSWVQLPNSGLTGTFGAGACGELRALGAMGGVFNQTATAGTTTTITTNRTIVRSLKDRKLRVVSGTGVGYEGLISSNTIGTNSVITLAVANGVAFDNTTVFQVFSGSYWLQGASASAGFGVYDLATNTWTAKTAVGVTWGTDGQLVSTLSSAGYFVSTLATSATSTTIVDSTKSWLTNMWSNYQVRIISGTGIGQIRTISSNTGTTLTISSAWTVTPDNTSTFVIEGNDDYFYLLGNSAVTLYRYSVTSNTWTTLSPSVARASSAGAGLSGNWIDNVSDWTLNTDGSANLLTTGLYKQNGRYIFSFRGSASNSLDIYDIAANTWINNVSYGNQMETFSTGSASIDFKGNIYLQKENTGRIFKFNIKDWVMQSFSYCPAVQSTATAGNKMAILPYQDGGTEIPFMYTMVSSQTTFLRTIII